MSADLGAARSVLRASRTTTLGPGGTGGGTGTAYLAALVVGLYAPIVWGALTAARRRAGPLLSGADPLLALVALGAVLVLLAVAARTASGC